MRATVRGWCGPRGNRVELWFMSLEALLGLRCLPRCGGEPRDAPRRAMLAPVWGCASVTDDACQANGLPGGTASARELMGAAHRNVRAACRATTTVAQTRGNVGRRNSAPLRPCHGGALRIHRPTHSSHRRRALRFPRTRWRALPQNSSGTLAGIAQAERFRFGPPVEGAVLVLGGRLPRVQGCRMIAPAA